MRVKYCQSGDCCPLATTNQLDYFRAHGWDIDSVTVAVCPAEMGLRERLFAQERAAQDRKLRAALAAPADLYFTNDVATCPLTQYLPADCKRVLAAAGPSFVDREHKDDLATARDAVLLNIEHDLYHLFDAVILPVEADGIRHAFHVPPSAPLPRPETGASFDLLIEGSKKLSNIRGINWFYRNVFVPHLWKHNVSLAIAGGVCERLNIQDANVTLLGRGVGTGRVVVVPVFEGSEFCAETLSGLANGRAVVTTPCGARGFEGAGLVASDMKANPGGTAAILLDLLASPARRQALERAAVVFVKQHHSREVYFAAMDRVMAAVGRR